MSLREELEGVLALSGQASTGPWEVGSAHCGEHGTDTIAIYNRDSSNEYLHVREVIETGCACGDEAIFREDASFIAAVANLIRDHGQALLDALDAEAKWKEMTDQARQIQHRHLDRHEGDVYHAMQSLASKFGHRWNAPITEAIDAAIKGDGAKPTP